PFLCRTPYLDYFLNVDQPCRVHSMHHFCAARHTWTIFSTLISRIRRSRQYAATPAGIQPAQAGTP
ncbi:MAG: hypothetical protein ACLFVO_24750, partial [Chloroflexaceae bacterium]